MVCNEEQDPKSPFNWWLKACIKAIDLEELIRQNQGLQTRNRAQELTGDRLDRTWLEAPRARPQYGRGRGRVLGQGLSPGPLFPGGYKYPPGVSEQRYTEF